jgi:hypothetical protein
MAVPTEMHHNVPRCLLRLRDRADAAALDGEGIELWLEFEYEAARYGVDPHMCRDDLAALIDASCVVMARAEYRATHESDFIRWGRRGGLETLQRYGRAWFALLGRRRHGRITRTQLTAAAADLAGHV